MERKGKERTQRYVKLDDEMTESAAWTSISVGAIWLYIELRKTFNFNKGGNNHLILPRSKVMWRMGSKSFAKRMQELVDYGFIDRIQQGGLHKQPSIYKLSEKWRTKSREVVTTEGREAIRLGLARKPTSRDMTRNLEGKRSWES